MSVAIRLTRTGKKKQAYYRIVAIDSRKARDSKYLELLGTYSPVDKPAKIDIKEALLTEWLDRGAIPSDTVRTLLSQIGFMEKYHKMKLGQDVTDMAVKDTITERPKKTRKMKKAAVAAAEAKEKEAAEAEKARADEAKAEETKADEGAEEAKAEEPKAEEAKPAEGEAEKTDGDEEKKAE